MRQGCAGSKDRLTRGVGDLANFATRGFDLELTQICSHLIVSEVWQRNYLRCIVCVCARVCVRVFVCMSVCVCVCVCVRCILMKHENVGGTLSPLFQLAGVATLC